MCGRWRSESLAFERETPTQERFPNVSCQSDPNSERQGFEYEISAEREGFEPSRRVNPAHAISNRAP